MLEILAAKVSRIRSRTTIEVIRDTAFGSDNGGTPKTRLDTQLFHCSACEAVYIDTEKQRCPTCDQTVEEVPATLRQ